MFRFRETKVTKEIFYAAKKAIKIWDITVDNIFTSKLVITKTNSKYLIGYLDKNIRPLVLIIPGMSGYVNTFKVKDEDEDTNNKLMSLHIDDEKLWEQYKTIWTKIEDLKNIKLNGLTVYDDRHTKQRTSINKVYTNFHGLNVSEDDIKCQFFTAISYSHFNLLQIVIVLFIPFKIWSNKFIRKFCAWRLLVYRKILS